MVQVKRRQRWREAPEGQGVEGKGPCGSVAGAMRGNALGPWKFLDLGRDFTVYTYVEKSFHCTLRSVYYL